MSRLAVWEYLLLAYYIHINCLEEFSSIEKRY